MKVAHSSTTSTDAVRTPLPAEPKHRLTAVMPEALRAIDWNGHVPTAPHGPVTMTRAQVQEQLAAEAGDDNDRWLPKLPVKRRPADKPLIPGQRGQAYDAIVLGAIHAHSAFAA